MERRIVRGGRGLVKPWAREAHARACYDGPMQRPIRIPIFGVICLVFGLFILLQNFGQLNVVIIGADAVQVPPKSESAGQVQQSTRISTLAMQEALREPAYRIGLGLKSVLSLLMVGMLIGAGVGLLRNQPWSIRLARTWGLYAILSGIAITVMQSVYVVPKMELPPALAMHIGMFLMLLLQSIFPVLLLFLLPSRKVVAYLKHKSSGTPMALPQANAPQNTATQDTTPQSSVSPKSTPAEPAPPTRQTGTTDTTWRDDPWNDPSSR